MANGGSTGSTIGGILGGAAGAYFGGPTGAAMGYGAGSSLGGAIGGGSDPSANWTSFGPRLGRTLNLEQSAISGLQNALSTPGLTPQQAANYISQFKAMVGQGVGGYGMQAGMGQFSLPDVPGATGTQHEGGLTADFGTQMQALRDRIAAIQSGTAGTTAGLQPNSTVPNTIQAPVTNVTGASQGLGLTNAVAPAPSMSTPSPTGGLDPNDPQNKSRGLTGV